MSVWQIFLRVIPWIVAFTPYALFRDAAYRQGPAAVVLLVACMAVLSALANRVVVPLWRPPG